MGRDGKGISERAHRQSYEGSEVHYMLKDSGGSVAMQTLRVDLGDDYGMKWPRMRRKKELGQSMLRVKDIEVMLECGGEKVWHNLSILYFGKSYPFSSVLS